VGTLSRRLPGILERRVFFLVLEAMSVIRPTHENGKTYLDALRRGPNALPTRRRRTGDGRQRLSDTTLVIQRVCGRGAGERVLQAGVCGNGVCGRGARNDRLGHRPHDALLAEARGELGSGIFTLFPVLIQIKLD
jgi:hypothetical protein